MGRQAHWKADRVEGPPHEALPGEHQQPHDQRPDAGVAPIAPVRPGTRLQPGGRVLPLVVPLLLQRVGDVQAPVLVGRAQEDGHAAADRHRDGDQHAGQEHPAVSADALLHHLEALRRAGHHQDDHVRRPGIGEAEGDDPRRPQGAGPEAADDGVGGDDGTGEPGDPPFADDAGDPQVEEEGQAQVEERDPGRESEEPEPEADEGEAAGEEEDGGAVGHDLVPFAGVHLRRQTQGAAPDGDDVPPPVPQADDHQGDEGAQPLEGEGRRRARPRTHQRVRVAAPRQRRDDLVGHVDEVVEADPQGHVAADEVGEPEHHEADAEAHLRDLAEQVDVLPAHVDRVQGVVAGQTVVDADDEGEEETEPEDPVAEQGLDQTGARAFVGVVLDHGDGQLHHRVDEPLVVDPLLAQDDGDRDHGDPETHRHRPPADQQDRQPHPPRHRAVAGPFVETADVLEVMGGYHPARNVGDHRLGPGVLRGDVVGHGGDVGQQVVGQAVGGDAGADDPHHVDLGQLGRRQHPVALEESQQGVHDQRHQEQHEVGADGVVPGGESSDAEDVGGVVEPRPDDDAPEGADDEPAVGAAEDARCVHASRGQASAPSAAGRKPVRVGSTL